MRWEEIWDISLRIQHLFMSGVYPAELRLEITELVRQQFDNKPVVIRSSAPEEDGSDRSFAGLHESYLNVSGIDQILKKIKKVWASIKVWLMVMLNRIVGFLIETKQNCPNTIRLQTANFNFFAPENPAFGENRCRLNCRQYLLWVKNR